MCGDKAPVRCPPPLTKGGRGDFASDGTHRCTSVVRFDLALITLVPTILYFSASDRRDKLVQGDPCIERVRYA